MITYENTPNGNIKVILTDAIYKKGKYVGDIKKNKTNGWWYYKPKGGGAGQEMGTIAEVKASLEEE